MGDDKEEDLYSGSDYNWYTQGPWKIESQKIPDII